MKSSISKKFSFVTTAVFLSISLTTNANEQSSAQDSTAREGSRVHTTIKRLEEHKRVPEIKVHARKKASKANDEYSSGDEHEITYDIAAGV